MTLDGFIKHVFPDSAVRPMVDNEILQIVVFSIFFGVACAAMGARSRVVLEGIEGLSHIILRVTGYVMTLAPVAVFCAMAATISTNGLGILVSYAKFMGEFYFGLVCLWALLIVAGFLIPRAQRHAPRAPRAGALPARLLDGELGGGLPKMLEQLAKFPISRKISSFVLPLGYSFNLDGTMMYCTFATVFIAQAYDIPLSFGTQVAMLLTLMLTSKGVAGVPRASLVVIAATLSQFSLPEEGLLLILGIDTFLDMGRSAPTSSATRSPPPSSPSGRASSPPTRTPARRSRTWSSSPHDPRLPLLAALAAAWIAGSPARAEDGVLDGTLKTIRDRGTILIGYREGAVPFSFLNRAGQPVGFSMDLCRGIAADVAAALGRDLVEPDAPAWQTGGADGPRAGRRGPAPAEGDGGGGRPRVRLDDGERRADAERRVLADLLPGRHQADGPGPGRRRRGLLPGARRPHGGGGRGHYEHRGDPAPRLDRVAPDHP